LFELKNNSCNNRDRSRGVTILGVIVDAEDDNDGFWIDLASKIFKK